jgi:hypothetical protein
VDDIKAWGLLWTHNSFVYESMNGFFTKLIHGTQKIPLAAIQTLNSLQQLGFKDFHVSFECKEARKLNKKLSRDSIK